VVGIHVIHVHVDHPEQALDLLEAHLTVLVRVCPVQIGVDPGVGAQEIRATDWAHHPPPAGKSQVSHLYLGLGDCRD
jgi:hypothetical protein